LRFRLSTDARVHRPRRKVADPHLTTPLLANVFYSGDDMPTVDTGLVGATDIAHIQFATASGRILVTQDDDFLRLHAEGITHAGIAYCHQQSMSIGELLRSLILIHDLLTPEEMVGRVEFL
jgi:hypothetical protein